MNGGEGMLKSRSDEKKRIEKALSQWGAKVVEATEKTYSAKKLCGEANLLLMAMQTEIAELYAWLDERGKG